MVKSLQTAISQTFNEGDLIKVSDLNGAVYEILGGQKRLVSPFVFNQRFSGSRLKSRFHPSCRVFPEGAYVTPIDGTLVKFDKNPTVYIIQNGQKLPITYQVFLQRGFSFDNVNTLSYEELNSWVTGSFLPPVDGTLVKAVTKQNSVLGNRPGAPPDKLCFFCKPRTGRFSDNDRARQTILRDIPKGKRI